ncbi:MAG: pyrimidine reductase family protein [Jiangellales bacterium]
MQNLFPPTTVAEVSTESVFGDYAYPALAGGRWWLRANMLSSVDGAVTGADGRSGSLSTDTDRALLRHLRGLCDAILVGAGTARTEDYGPPTVDEPSRALREASGQAARPRLVVVSRSLSLDPAARLFSGPDRVIVVTSRAADWNAVERLAQVADVVRAGDDAVDLADLLGVLADQGLRRLLCEGGPSLLADLVSGRLLDELCLTTVPTLVGGGAPRIVAGASPDPRFDLNLASLASDSDGTLFSRWVRG